MSNPLRFAARSSALGRPEEGFEVAEKFSQLARRARITSDVSSAAADRFWPCWVLGDAPRAQRYSAEALRMAERFGSYRNIVYTLMVCGNASTLALRWEEGNGFLERARRMIDASEVDAEWSVFIDAHQALAWGLVDRIVDADALEQTVAALVSDALGADVEHVGAIKRLFQTG